MQGLGLGSRVRVRWPKPSGKAHLHLTSRSCYLSATHHGRLCCSVPRSGRRPARVTAEGSHRPSCGQRRPCGQVLEERHHVRAEPLLAVRWRGHGSVPWRAPLCLAPEAGLSRAACRRPSSPRTLPSWASRCAVPPSKVLPVAAAHRERRALARCRLATVSMPVLTAA
jgi:hypothetical protein